MTLRHKPEVAIVIAAIIAIVACSIVWGTKLSILDVVGAALPLVGGAMGAYVSVKPPEKHPQQIAWLLGFVVLGIAAFGLQLRQSNLQQIADAGGVARHEQLTSQNRELLDRLKRLGDVSTGTHKDLGDLLKETKEKKDAIPLAKEKTCDEKPCVFSGEATWLADHSKIGVEFQNSGHVLAQEICTSLRSVFHEQPIDVDSIGDPLDKCGGSGNLAPAAKGKLFVETHPAARESAFEGKSYVIVYGQIGYSDGKKVYFSRFCYQWAANLKAFTQCPANKFTRAQKI